MDETGTESPAAKPKSRRRLRRGVLARLSRWLGLATELRDAAVALVRAETRLARAALPLALVWLVVSLMSAIMLVACVGGGLLLLLYRWTGSLPLALLWLAAGSVLVLGVAVLRLSAALRAASFVQSRRHIGNWLERSEQHDRANRHTAGGS